MTGVDEKMTESTPDHTQKKHLNCSRNAQVMDKPFVLNNLIRGTQTTDTLHFKAANNYCTDKYCAGSLYKPQSLRDKRKTGEVRPKEQVKEDAITFLEEYYQSIQGENSVEHKNRLQEVCSKIDATGTYDMMDKELMFGARLAWRNAPRCIGRIQWKKLQLFDCRHVTTAKEMFECICTHLKYATNNGNIRSTITVFPRRKEKGNDFKVWNVQLLGYAGYRKSNGEIIGDGGAVDFTEFCQQFGWVGEGTPFDILPLIIQANGGAPELFEVPKELILQVNISHPQYPALKELGLKWFAVPTVSSMLLDCGGLEFTGIPFNGWYMTTEIGARHFIDTSRYNLGKKIANLLGLDTSNNTTMWKDEAMVAITKAVGYSFNNAGATIVDLHTASEQFMKHFQDESQLRGGCPSDWVWVVPPLSGSGVEVFHQEMLLYQLKPFYEYQPAAWKNYCSHKTTKGSRSLKSVAKAVQASTKAFQQILTKRTKVKIIYATETGKSESFARSLNDLFLHGFDSTVVKMSEYSVQDLAQDQCVIFVASTFGNGEAPDMGQDFLKNLEDEAKKLNKPKCPVTNSSSAMLSLENVRFSVFALGSRAYPYFCAFGKNLSNLMQKLGGEEVYPLGEGDELCGQDESFKIWASSCFQAICDAFCVTGVQFSKVCQSFFNVKCEWTGENFQITKAGEQEEEIELKKALSKLHKKDITEAEVTSVENLQSPESSRVTDLVRLELSNSESTSYAPGDHLCIYPNNDESLVVTLLGAVKCDVNIDTKINAMEKIDDESSWQAVNNLPMPTTLRRIFTNYLDITTPPSAKVLSLFATFCSETDQKKRLEKLATDNQAYEAWKHQYYCNVYEVLKEFTAVKVDTGLLIKNLPLLKPRYYSISSSQAVHKNEVHATVALVSYKTDDDVHHLGVCSSWLHSLKPGAKVPCFLKSVPKFHLPKDVTAPVIMVGPGTGIAPFRAFWQQLIHEKQKENKRRDALLFFGCRNPQFDHIYKNEMGAAVEHSAMKNVFAAYSRHHELPKKYVQDLLMENKEEVCELLVNGGAHLYICGDITMAAGVTKVITNMLQVYCALSPEEALMEMEELKNEGRFHEDIFGLTLKHKEVTTSLRAAIGRRLRRQGTR